jgi:hypothetical protein
MINHSEKLSLLLAYIQADGGVCPQTAAMEEGWEMLPANERRGGGWNPSLPLILGLRHNGAIEKQLRLRRHVGDLFLRSHAEECHTVKEA